MMFTSLSRLVPGYTVIKSMIVPCSIQSETIARVREDLTAPISGNRFGCLNCFHSTTSRQKFYPVLVSIRQASELQSGRLYLFHADKVPSREDPQLLDGDLGALVHSAIDTCVAASSARELFDPLQFISYSVRGW